MIFLLRMTMFPFSIMSYLLGVTSISFWNYLVGTSSVFVHVILWLYIGSTLTIFVEDDDKPSISKKYVERVVLAGQILLAIGIGIYIARVAKREFEREMKDLESKH